MKDLPKEWRMYQRKGATQMRPYVEGESLPDQVSISEADRLNGSPKAGDMIARNVNDHSDMWLVAKKFFNENYSKR